MKNLLTKSLITLALAGGAAFGAVAIANAAGGKQEIEYQKWGFQGMFGKYDRAAMQRGYQVYKEVCASCHALEHLSFRHLGEKGGPFYDKKFPNPNDNEIIKAFAKDWEVEDIDQDTGDIITRPGIPADKFPKPFPNAIAAAASNGGAVPPDLSLIVPGRTAGVDYLYSLLMGYDEHHKAPEGTYYNKAFEAKYIKMAPPLADGLVEYMDGTEASAEQMARDVTEFLAWAGDPNMEVRKKTGFATILFLFIFSLLLFMTYKQVWRGEEH